MQRFILFNDTHQSNSKSINSSTDDPSPSLKSMFSDGSCCTELVFVRVPLNEASQVTVEGQDPLTGLLESVATMELLLKLPERELPISNVQTPTVD